MTVLDKPAIKRLVLALRHALEDDYEAVLRRYGLFSDRDWVAPEKLPRATPELLHERARMVAAMQPELSRIKAAGTKDANKAQQEATRWYVREAAFTMLNRLVGLKCLEVRKLFPEVIQTRVEYGGRSEYHRDWRAANPVAAAGPDDGLSAMLLAAFREVTTQIGTLFDPQSDSSVVLPRYTTLKTAIERINELPESNWLEDEIIGWVYQFYNAEEKETIRKRGKPRLPIEVAVINQFFTPRWVIKFLVDNTLGRLWLEMHPDSPRVRAKCDYLVPEPLLASDDSSNDEQKAQQITLDPDSPINNADAKPRRTPKQPQELKLIDPACGTMHFGHYAFEVFTAIYQDARDLRFVPSSAALSDTEIPLAILRHNLHGVDIDLRAVQLAALALYLKARVALRDLHVDADTAAALPWQVNLVSADARLPANGMREQFLSEYEDDPNLIKAWRELFAEMEDIAQVGSLLRVEQRFKAILEQRRPATVKLSEQSQDYIPGFEPSVQQLTFGDTPVSDWTPRRSLQEMLGHLRRFARAALDAADVNAQLFATEAAKTLGLLDVLMQEYDVVVMNPPYGDQQTNDLREYLDVLYKDTKTDSAISFVKRGIELIHMRNGVLGALTPRSFMYLSSFSKTRQNFYQDRHYIPALLELGIGVLDDATVRTSAFILSKSDFFLEMPAVFWDLSNISAKENNFISTIGDYQKGLQSENIYNSLWKDFRNVPGMSLSYNMPSSILNQFSRFPALDVDVSQSKGNIKIADVKVGLQTGNDELFVRCHWEITARSNIWKAFSKGGEFSPYYRDFELVVYWANDGFEIKNYKDENGHLRSRPQNSSFYGKRGLTYPATSERGIGAHYMPDGTIISVKGSGIYPNSKINIWCLLAFLNSELFWGFLRVFTADREHQVGMIANFPIILPDANSQQVIASLSREVYDLKFDWDTRNEISTRFNKPWLLEVGQQHGDDFDLTVVLHELDKRESEADFRLETIQNQIDDSVYDLYEISIANRSLLKRRLESRPPVKVWPQMETKSTADKHKEHVRRLLSYLLLETMKGDQDGVIPLIGGTGERTALERLHAALENQFGKAALEVEDAAARVLGRSIASWLDADYGKWHTALYKNRPIVWHLASEKGTFAVLLYYHRLTADTLPRLRSTYIRRLLDDLGTAQRTATEAGKLGDARKLEEQADDLRVFDERLANVINAGYDPVIDDGVKKNITPLQEAGLLRYKVV